MARSRPYPTDLTIMKVANGYVVRNTTGGGEYDDPAGWHVFNDAVEMHEWMDDHFDEGETQSMADLARKFK